MRDGRAGRSPARPAIGWDTRHRSRKVPVPPPGIAYRVTSTTRDDEYGSSL